MALSGFGLNAAVQAFPQMYEFGRSLFGQDNASKAQAFKEKQAEAELALKQREMEDMAAYRAGVLRGQDFQNQTGRMGVNNAYDLGVRGADIQQQNADTSRKGVDNAYALGVRGADIQQQNADTSRTQVENAGKYQQGQIEVAQGHLGVAQRANEDLRNYRAAAIRNEEARIRQEGQRIGLSETEIKARIDHLGEQTRGLRGENQFNEAMQAEMAADKTLEDRFDEAPTSLSKSEMAKLNMRYNPHAKEAAQAFDEAANAYVRTQDPKVFTPEVVAAVGRGIQPMLNLNSKYGDGALQLEGFEPANENGMGGVRVKLRKTVKGDDGQMHTTSTYLTEDRGDLADGAKPRIFTGQELHQMLSSLRSIGELQDRHQEVASDRQLRLQAWKLSGGTNQGYQKALWDLTQGQLAANATAEEKALKEAEYLAKQRGANVKDVMTALDNVHNIRSLEPYDGTRGTPEYQNLMAAREKLQSATTEAMQAASRDALRDGDPMGILNHPKVAKAYEEYKALYNRYVPPPRGEDQVPAETKHPQTGPINNPGFPPPGGGVSPLSQAAPSQGGRFAPASYRPQQALAMPKNLQISGTAKQFGVEKVDPSLMEGVKAAAQLWPGTVDLFSSGRGKGDKGNHSSWHALDVGLITPEGQYLPNHIKKKWHGGGSSAAHHYERFWQAAVLWAAQDDPSILNRFRWGGNFREQDYMHGDTLRGVKGKTTGAGTLFGGRDTRYGGGKTMPVQDLNELGRQLYGSAWRGIPGLQRMA